MNEDNGNDDLNDLGEMLRVNSRARGRGDYWFWRDKPEGETGAAKAVLTITGHRVVGLCPRKLREDPPDCEATIDGKWSGIEVSELLDQTTLEASIRGVESQYFEWKEEDFLSALQQRIDRKDCPAKLKGGPYERYFLVIVTDELFLYRERVAQFLAGVTFTARLITDAYLSLSYHPELGGKGSCPVFKLAIVPRLA